MANLESKYMQKLGQAIQKLEETDYTLYPKLNDKPRNVRKEKILDHIADTLANYPEFNNTIVTTEAELTILENSVSGYRDKEDIRAFQAEKKEILQKRISAGNGVTLATDDLNRTFTKLGLEPWMDIPTNSPDMMAHAVNGYINDVYNYSIDVTQRKLVKEFGHELPTDTKKDINELLDKIQTQSNDMEHDGYGE